MIYKPDLSYVPDIIPLPLHVEGVRECAVNLDDGWKRCDSLPEEYWKNDTDGSAWTDASVPDDVPAMLRLVRGRKPVTFAYKRLGGIPADFSGKDILLRFEGAQGFVSVWIDGRFAGRHDNGFLTWELDITGLVTPGQPFLLTVGVENHKDDVIGDNLGGLVRPVKLICVPKTHIGRLHVETSFDGQYVNAVLKVMLSVPCHGRDAAKVKLALYDPDGRPVDIENNIVEFAGSRTGRILQFNIASPVHWDAEHPFLYTLKAELYAGELYRQSTIRKFGFRQVQVRGNRMLVNGMEVKLRGACRHDITAHHGHAMGRSGLERDILLFKEANINYIRTSHYPPYEEFLDLCDEYGIYVEDETAFAFIGSTLKFTQKSPHLSQRYIEFMAALIERDRSHPSVIIWSLANESIFGRNFALINRYAHLHDPSRPTKFSYPMTMPLEEEPVDIWSVHYNGCDTALDEKHDNLGLGGIPGRDRPILNDEYAHLASYNRPELRRDPAVRSFWGAGFYKFWDNIRRTPGALGGAIWAGIDHTPCRESLDHYEWGIVDIWRRKKPEFWYLKKAYSPVRLPADKLPLPCGGRIEVPVENRFCHTNLREIRIEWNTDTESGQSMGSDIAPFHTGVFRLDVPGLKDGGLLRLRFFDASGRMVEEHSIQIGDSRAYDGNESGEGLLRVVTADAYEIRSDNFLVAFSKKTGLFSAGYKDELLIRQGPFLNLVGVDLPAWELGSLSVGEYDGGKIRIEVCGRYGKALDVTFNITVDGSGRIAVCYTVDKMDIRLPWTMKLRVGVHCGGLSELGIYYILDGGINRLAWKRKGLHTAYPQDHISRLEGVARRDHDEDPGYGEEPGISWAESSRNYFLNGKYDTGRQGTNDFRSTKHNIYWASAYREKGRAALRAISDASDSVRMEIVPDASAFIDDRDSRVSFVGTWYRLEAAGCIGGSETVSNMPGDYAECTFTGAGIAWIGSVDTNYGIAKVYVDGKVMDHFINNRVDIVDFAGSAAGFDKQYRRVLYSVEKLRYGQHTIRIEVTGLRGLNATDAYISIDSFQVLGDGRTEDVKMIINSRYNYPGLSWGNAASEPVTLEKGSRGRSVVRLEGMEPGK